MAPDTPAGTNGIVGWRKLGATLVVVLGAYILTATGHPIDLVTSGLVGAALIAYLTGNVVAKFGQ